MSMTLLRRISRRGRRRLGHEQGFTMIIAIGVMFVTALLTAAAFIAVTENVFSTRHDLDGKNAYYAAQAGLSAYLYQLNQNPNYWDTCANDVQSTTTVPGSTNGETYSYKPIYNSGYTSSNCSTSPISALIDPNTGTLRMEFTGDSAAPQAPQVQVSRVIVAGFRKSSPLDFLWYTVYEAIDPSINGYNGCNVFYRNGRSSICNISWVNGDTINGPMYTQDQYLIGGTATFGRGANDKIESAAPGTAASDICTSSSCGSLNLLGTAVPNAGTISIPADNSLLQTDATNHGLVYSGTTSVTLNGTSATVVNCPGSSASSSCTTSAISITTDPIIYVQNASGCTPPTYTPFGASYPISNTTGGYYGCSGDVYVSGSYTSPFTVAAAKNIIVTGNLTTNLSGGAALGLVANGFVRVMHGVSARGSTEGSCTSNGTTTTNISSQTMTSPTIDAAILSLQHSFIVDNFDCGAALQDLTVNGAIAQYYRGAVGTSSGGTIKTGYTKQYTYDDRLAVLLPPYLFDISTSGWHMERETLCTPGGSAPATAC